MTNTERDQYRRKLFALGSRLKGDFAQLSDEALRGAGGEASGNLSNMPFHPADLGTDNYEQEVTLSLLENGDQVLEETAAALDRLEQGTFGTCENCGREINRARLNAVPYTRYCIDCARDLDTKPG